ncbi:MAG: hypothetical protein LBE56_09055 [Tannerella sp.]|jgi:hypothetical protein|nr:hypothetical protein [Tannerella sp.]
MQQVIRYFFVILMFFSTMSCAVLTTSQLKMVNQLTVASDTVAAAPKTLFAELAAVRLERGLFYAASLTSAEAREKEINALATATIADQKLIDRTDVYVSVLESYLRALRSLSNDVRWEQYGTEWRGLGRNIDSLLLRFNQIDLLDTPLTIGWGKLSGQYMGYLNERYMRTSQAKTVKSFVTEGDTLVATCVDGLIEVLRTGAVADLIENESEGLKNNYSAYLHRLEMSGEMPDIALDRKYIELTQRVEKAIYTRSRCITALQSLKRAHKKLVTELAKRQRIDFLFDEMIELNTLALNLESQLTIDN